MSKKKQAEEKSQSKSKRVTFYMPEKLADIFEKLLALPDIVSVPDLLRTIIKDYAKKRKVI